MNKTQKNTNTEPSNKQVESFIKRKNIKYGLNKPVNILRFAETSGFLNKSQIVELLKIQKNSPKLFNTILKKYIDVRINILKKDIQNSINYMVDKLNITIYEFQKCCINNYKSPILDTLYEEKKVIKKMININNIIFDEYDKVEYIEQKFINQLRSINLHKQNIKHGSNYFNTLITKINTLKLYTPMLSNLEYITNLEDIYNSLAQYETNIINNNFMSIPITPINKSIKKVSNKTFNELNNRIGNCFDTLEILIINLNKKDELLMNEYLDKKDQEEELLINVLNGIDYESYDFVNDIKNIYNKYTNFNNLLSKKIIQIEKLINKQPEIEYLTETQIKDIKNKLYHYKIICNSLTFDNLQMNYKINYKLDKTDKNIMYLLECDLQNETDIINKMINKMDIMISYMNAKQINCKMIELDNEITKLQNIWKDLTNSSNISESYYLKN